MNRTAFLIGHIIGLVGGVGFVIILGDVFDLDLAAMLCLIGGLLCFVCYSVIAMRLRFMHIGWDPRWVGWVFFPGFGQLLWFVLVVVCAVVPGNDENLTERREVLKNGRSQSPSASKNDNCEH